MHQGMGRAAEVHPGVIIMDKDVPLILETIVVVIRIILEVIR